MKENIYLVRHYLHSDPKTQRLNGTVTEFFGVSVFLNSHIYLAYVHGIYVLCVI